MNDIVILYVDSFGGIYVNGKIKHESDSIGIEHITRCLPILSLRERFVDNTPIQDYVIKNSYFPETLAEVEQLIKGEIND